MSPHLLFQHVSLALFSPLAAPGAAFYSEVLLTLFTETQRHQEPLSRETALRIVLDLLEDLNAFDVTMNLDEDLPFEDDMERRRAGTVLRYLTRCYWLHEEIQRDFTIVYTLPDYAFRMLTVLYEIAHDTKPPLQGLICTIHDLLQAAVREGNESIRIPQAYRETLRLLNGLKELQHNIGVQIEIVLRQVEPRDVLEQTFGTYLRDTTRKTYHELRTTDHVSRFRPGINMALALLGTDSHLAKIEQHTSIDIQEIVEQIQAIQLHFDTLDHLLQAIDTRHRQFFDVAIRSVERKLMAESTTSGHLHTLLTHIFAQSQTDEKMGEAVWDAEPFIDSLLCLHELALPDQKSLWSPRRPRDPFVPESEEYIPLTHEEITVAREAVLAQMLRSISREQVRAYARKLLGESEERSANTFPITGPDDLPMLMYLRAYGNGMLGYRVVELPQAEKIVCCEVEFRNFLIRRQGW